MSKFRVNLLTLVAMMMLLFLAGCTGPSEAADGSELDNQADIGLESEDVAKESSVDVGPKSTKKSKLSMMEVHFIDVGQADSALIKYDDHAILIDGGDWNKNEVVPYLRSQNVEKLDLVVGTHPHADHIGQLDKVMENFEVDEVWLSGGENSSAVFDRLLTSISAVDANYNEPKSGEKYSIGNLNIEILNPNGLIGNLNDDSIVMKLTYGDVSFMFTGDIENSAEQKIVKSGSNINATILKVSHHGSDTSTSQEFLDKVNPEVAVISAAEKSKYNHPNKSIVDRLEEKGLDMYATKTHGNIVISTDGKDYAVTKDKEGTVLPGDDVKVNSDERDNSANSNIKDESPKPIEQPTEQPVRQPDNPVSQPTPNPVEPPVQAPVETPADNGNASSAYPGCVDINTASVDELRRIIHIDEKRAPLVIEKRPFSNVDGLIRVNGIAEKRMADIHAQGLACVN